MILLIYPKHNPFPHSISAPLSIFCLGSFIEQKGGKVEYFDERVQGWPYLRNLLDGKPLLVGISAMTSYQIKRGIAIASFIRRSYPDLPLVWGGIHPTMCTEQTLESGLVDFIIKGEGEAPLYDLADALSSSRHPEFWRIDNLAWKENGMISENKNRNFLDINQLPFAYSGKAKDMAGLYLSHHTCRESIAMESSRGCNFSCRFCYNSFFNRSICRPKSKDRLEAEISGLKEIGAKELIFVDDNLGASRQHVEGLCAITRKYGFKWSGGMRTDIIDEALLKVLENGGCKYLFFGIESIDLRVLDYIGKKSDTRKVDQVIRWVSKTSIVPTYSFMNGFPRENEETLAKHLEYIDNLHRVDPRAEVAVQPYNPLPGTLLYQEALESGFKAPERLDDWWKMTTGEVLGPWVKDRTLLKNLYLISFLVFRRQRFLKNFLFLPLHISAKLRWRARFFKFCWERLLYKAMVKVYIIFDSIGNLP